jgi:hypothetical protein
MTLATARILSQRLSRAIEVLQDACLCAIFVPRFRQRSLDRTTVLEGSRQVVQRRNHGGGPVGVFGFPLRDAPPLRLMRSGHTPCNSAPL